MKLQKNDIAPRFTTIDFMGDEQKLNNSHKRGNTPYFF